MPLPAQARPDADLVHLDQARAVLAPGGPGTCRAEYRAALATRTAAAAVTVIVSAPPRKPGEPGFSPLTGPALPQHARRSGFVLQVAAIGPDETLDAATGVGHLGGVLALGERDRFLVPGWAVGRQGESEVLLTAHLGGRCHGGMWSAEVAP